MSFGSRYLRNLRSHCFPVSTLLYHCWSPAVSGLSHTSSPLSLKISFFFREIKNSFLQLSMVSRTTNPSSLAASLKVNLSWKIPKSQVNAMMILKWWKCSMMKNTLKWRSHYFKLHINCMLTNFDVIFISNCQVNDGATHKQGAMQENFWPPVFLEILNKT